MLIFVGFVWFWGSFLAILGPYLGQIGAPGDKYKFWSFGALSKTPEGQRPNVRRTGQKNGPPCEDCCEAPQPSQAATGHRFCGGRGGVYLPLLRTGDNNYNLYLVFGRFPAELGPETRSSGSGSKNGEERTQNEPRRPAVS